MPTKEELKAEIETQKAMFYLQQQDNEENGTDQIRNEAIYSSLRIEANSLSIGQVRDVISGQLVLGEQKR